MKEQSRIGTYKLWKTTNLFLISCLCLFTNMAQAQDPVVLDKIVAQVGGEIILYSDLTEQIELAKSQGYTQENMECAFLDQLLSQKLMLNQSKIDSVEVTPEEVENQLDARIERILTYMGGDVSQFEEYYGQSINDVKKQFRQDLTEQLLAERMQQNILFDVNITPKEVTEFFATIPKDSLPYFNSEVELGEIVYYPEVNPIEEKRAFDLATELRRRIIEDGEPFEELAAKYSQDPGSGRAGGDLGWAKRGSYVPEFEAAAYNLEKDEITEPIKTEFGYHIIQHLDRRGNSIHLRHILISPEITEDDINLAEKKLDSIKMLIENDSISFAFAVNKYSSDKEQSYNNSGNMVNPKSGNTFFEIGDLDPDIYFAIDTLKLNKISAPIRFTNPRGKVAFRLIKLYSRTNPHVANLNSDYSKIKAAALESKKGEYVEKWVIDHVNTTLFEIEEEMMSCEGIKKWNPTLRTGE